MQENLLTIDLEEWFHSNFNNNLEDDYCKKVRVVDNTIKLLDIFDLHNFKATFFVLGYVAKEHPDLIREIQIRGHEIASHGFDHQLVYRQTPEQFRNDVLKSVELIENITQRKVKGYRAPSWSITDDSTWAWRILDEMGFAYDSSVFPTKNFLYGMPSSPRFCYHPTPNGERLNLIEIPPSTLRVFNINIPFSGGAYFRLYPYIVIKLGIKTLNRNNQPDLV